MIKDILQYFLLRRATLKTISNVLENENFVYNSGDVENLLRSNEAGARYGTAILTRNENGQKKERFLKVMIDGKFRTFKLFRRQAAITDALHKDSRYQAETTAVIKISLKSPVPYAIFETRDASDSFGFLEDSKIFYDQFSQKDLENLVMSVYEFHGAGMSIDKSIWNYTQETFSNLTYYKKQIQASLNQKITHKTLDGKLLVRPVKKILETYLDIENIEGQVIELFEENWRDANSHQKEQQNYLVHGDLHIDNVYKKQDGTFELLDFEWVGRTTNPALAIMYDYGDLRARAWSSLVFQQKLDEAMLSVGKKYYKEIRMIEAALVLGILRSGVMMCRFHLDFINTVIKDKRTEKAYQSMYPKTLDTLSSVLNKKLKTNL